MAIKTLLSGLIGVCALSVTACGNEAEKGSGVASSALSDEASSTLNQVRLIKGNFKATSDTSECKAIQSKVFGNRSMVQLESEWQTVTQTQEYDQLEGLLDSFHSAGCDDQGETKTDQCNTLQSQLADAADSLGKTPQWSTLGNNEKWTQLKGDYVKGQKINCFEKLVNDEG